MNNNLNTCIYSTSREIDKTTKQSQSYFSVIYFHVYENIRPWNFDKDAVSKLDSELTKSTKMIDEEVDSEKLSVAVKWRSS